MLGCTAPRLKMALQSKGSQTEIIMNETKQLEKATAEAFIKLFNRENNCNYRIVEYSENPDVRCKDDKGDEFDFDVTLTEDRPGDIKAMLGRSEHKSLEALKRHLELVEEGKASILERTSSLGMNVCSMLIQRIEPKLLKRYGPNTGLVIRDTSGVNWDWEYVLGDVKKNIPSMNDPYDKGIWLLNSAKTDIYKLT